MALIGDLISVYIIILLIRAVLSWILPTTGGGGVIADLFHVVYILTEPLLAPIRRLIGMHRIGGVGVDLSFLVLVIALVLIRNSL
jgi:YggT family protein